jgi:hypothetical protein
MLRRLGISVNRGNLPHPLTALLAVPLLNMSGVPLPYQWDLQDDVLRISTEGSKFEGRFSEDGNTFSGGWRPVPGMEGPNNIPYDISGTRVK